MSSLRPHPYQEEGINFLSSRRSAILGDDAGLGKSMQMILAADRLGLDRIIVLCPAIGRVSWSLQFQTWDRTKRPVVLFPDADEIPTGPVAVIVTLDWLSRKGNVLALRKKMGRMDVAFIDEVHYLKTPSANRTKAVYGARGNFKNAVLEGVPYVWAASATLTPNHAGELYTHLRALLPDVLRELFAGDLPTKQQFEARYCNVRHTTFGMKVDGNNRHTIPQLRDAFRPHFMMRRKADVLDDLPPIECVPLPLEVADKELRAAAVDAFFADVPPEQLTSDDDMMTLLGSALADPAVASRRRALGLVKIEPTVEWAKDFLASAPDRKLVIFAHHREVIDKVAHLMGCLVDYRSVKIHGGTTTAEKAAAVEAFQTDPKVRVFVGQTHAAGTSITLTAASDVLLVEPDWTPANNYQAISRCHRIGQNAGVIARFAYAHGTIDERISNLLRRRAADQAQLFGSAQEGYTERTGT